VLSGPADPDREAELGLFGTFNADLDRLREGLLEKGCQQVVGMESTGSYWKPVYAALEGSGIEVKLAHGEDVKARRGHKTDWDDCQFLANLLRHGMIRASFIPLQAIRDLRDLTRRRRQLSGAAVSERNRVQKVLEEANVKLGSVLSDVFGVSGQLMLEKLLDGEPDVEAIAELAQRKARQKIPELRQAREGHRLGDHHRTMLRLSLEHIAFLESQISAIDEEIGKLMEREGYQESFDLVRSVPGVQEITAAALLAETGAEMSVFPSAGPLCSWDRRCAGQSHERGQEQERRDDARQPLGADYPGGMRLGGSRAKQFCAEGTVSETECKGPQGRADRSGPPTRDPPASHSFFQAALPGIGRTLTGRTQTATTHSSLRASIGQTRRDGSFPASGFGEPLENQNRHEHPPAARGTLACSYRTIPVSC
jgi:transposase